MGDTQEEQVEVQVSRVLGALVSAGLEDPGDVTAERTVRTSGRTKGNKGWRYGAGGKQADTITKLLVKLGIDKDAAATAAGKKARAELPIGTKRRVSERVVSPGGGGSSAEKIVHSSDADEEPSSSEGDDSDESESEESEEPGEEEEAKAGSSRGAAARSKGPAAKRLKVDTGTTPDLMLAKNVRIDKIKDAFRAAGIPVDDSMQIEVQVAPRGRGAGLDYFFCAKGKRYNAIGKLVAEMHKMLGTTPKGPPVTATRTKASGAGPATRANAGSGGGVSKVQAKPAVRGSGVLASTHTKTQTQTQGKTPGSTKPPDRRSSLIQAMIAHARTKTTTSGADDAAHSPTTSDHSNQPRAAAPQTDSDHPDSDSGAEDVRLGGSRKRSSSDVKQRAMAKRTRGGSKGDQGSKGRQSDGVGSGDRDVDATNQNQLRQPHEPGKTKVAAGVQGPSRVTKSRLARASSGASHGAAADSGGPGRASARAGSGQISDPAGAGNVPAAAAGTLGRAAGTLDRVPSLPAQPGTSGEALPRFSAVVATLRQWEQRVQQLQVVEVEHRRLTEENRALREEVSSYRQKAEEAKDREALHQAQIKKLQDEVAQLKGEKAERAGHATAMTDRGTAQGEGGTPQGEAVAAVM